VAKIYLAEIILALEALHKNCIIFRDLKPENVVLDENGHALLTDFGFSKTGVEAGKLSFDFCGTPAYMAPEIIKKKGHSRQVDWYLLGILTYELLVGIPPYFADDKTKLY
jgi:serine/threonine protein kinase